MIHKIKKWQIIKLLPLFLAISYLHLFAEEPWATDQSQGKDLTIQLVTFGPGDIITTYFGHTAIIVKDIRLNYSRLYNFGLFSIEKDFLINFAKGRLIFYAGRARVANSLLRYSKENRDVIVQTLNLHPEKKLNIAKKLAWWVRPENNSYLYHHYLNNCSTIPRDILNEASDGKLYDTTKRPSQLTFRDFTKVYTSHKPFLMLLLMFLMNDSIDKPIAEWDGMFLPYELQDKINRVVVKNTTERESPIVAEEKFYFRAERKSIPEQVPSLTMFLLSVGIGIGILSLLISYFYIKNIRYFRTLFALYNILAGLVLGILGAALFLMSMFTDHVVTYHNENLFLANPLTLFLGMASMVWMLRKSSYSNILLTGWGVMAISSVLLLILKLFPPFDQYNAWEVALIIPINFSFVISHFLIRKHFKNREDKGKL